MKQTGHGKALVDPTIIRRAFSNLISNALKYGEPNSTLCIELIQETEECYVLIKNEISPDMQNLSQDELERFFDRFYRLDFARQRIIDGTGLGLAITRSIFKMHHASISVRIEQQYIIFEIIFPTINQSN